MNVQKHDADLIAKHGLAVLEGGQIATQNKRGMQMASLSPLFEDWVGSYDHEHPLCDIGCAYGLNVLGAVKRSVDVIGMDMGEEHFAYLRDLYHQATKEMGDGCGKLSLTTGSLPTNVDLPDESVSGLLVGEVLHFIRGKDMVPTFKTLLSKLVPGGTLCLHCVNIDAFKSRPDAAQAAADFETRLAAGEPWPGEMEYFMLEQRDDPNNLPEHARPDFFHVLTKEQVKKAATDAGFEVVSVVTGRHPGYPDVLSCDTANIQLVARKPR